jgi:tRNA-dihydrouridine synthase C
MTGPAHRGDLPPQLALAWSARAQVARHPGDPGLFLALAPMDGVTDWVYRALLTDLAAGESGISLCVSEFVRVTRGPVPGKVILRHCPELAAGGCTPAGVPVMVQLLGGDPTAMAQTASVAAELGAPGVDLNFGCPAKTVNNHDGGATILKTPQRVQRITSAVRQAVPPHIPVSVKIRLGWDSADGVEDIAAAAADAGAAWLTIHARTRTQLYRPPVDWASIGRARAAVNIPVVANGDISTPDDLLACGRASGCHAFMIGRGAMGRPGVFRRIRGADEPDLDLPWFVSLLVEYAHRLEASGAPERATIGRLKQWLRLGAPAFESLDALFQRTKRLHGLAPLIDTLNTVSPLRRSA